VLGKKKSETIAILFLRVMISVPGLDRKPGTELELEVNDEAGDPVYESILGESENENLDNQPQPCKP
jgi:hypothetical protein